MNDRVHMLPGVAPSPEVGEPNEDLIAHLRSMLDAAECGELQGMAAAMTRRDGRVMTVLSTNGEHFAMSHALGSLWWRFQHQMHEGSDPSGPEGI